MLEFDFDITRAVSIVVNGVMEHTPTSFVTVHSAARFVLSAPEDRVPAGSEQYLPNGLYAEVRKWYFDIARGFRGRLLPRASCARPMLEPTIPGTDQVDGKRNYPA
jgi:hypothetical protein